MKTIKKIGLSIALFPLLAAINAQAGMFDDFELIDNAGSKGGEFFEDVFFGGSFGQAEVDGFCKSSTDCNAEDTSWKVYGGYTLNDSMDVEIGYHSIGDINRTTAAGTEASELSAISIAGVGKYEVNETIELFGKVGAASWTSSNTSGETDGTGLTYGFGAKVSMNENMKIRAEWETIPDVDTGSNESDVSTMSLGIELKTL